MNQKIDQNLEKRFFFWRFSTSIQQPQYSHKTIQKLNFIQLSNQNFQIPFDVAPNYVHWKKNIDEYKSIWFYLYAFVPVEKISDVAVFEIKMLRFKYGRNKRNGRIKSSKMWAKYVLSWSWEEIGKVDIAQTIFDWKWKNLDCAYFIKRLVCRIIF